MALHSELIIDIANHQRENVFEVVDCKVVLDRQFDEHSPTGYTRLTTLKVTTSPKVGNTTLHKWFAEKRNIDVVLHIVLLNIHQDEEIQSLLLKDAVCSALSERTEKIPGQAEKRRRLVTVVINAQKVSMGIKSLLVRKREWNNLEYYTKSNSLPQAAVVNQPNAQIVEMNAAVLGIQAGEPMSIEEALKANPNFVARKIPNDGTKRPLVKQHYIHQENDGQGNMVAIDTTFTPKYIENPAFNDNNSKFQVNCSTCSTAYVLRSQGFKVTAKGRTIPKKGERPIDHTYEISCKTNMFKAWKNPDGTEATPTTVQSWMKKKKLSQMTPALYKEFIEENTQEEGIYIYNVGWRGKDGEKGGAHTTIIQRWRDEHGELHLDNIEPQNGKISDLGKICRCATPWPQESKAIMRVDNKVFNSEYLDIFEYDRQN